MAISGFQEMQAAFVPADTSNFVGQVRRFGPVGPAYEVIAVAAPGSVSIEVVESGERLDYPVTDFLADPLAETVP